MHNDVDSCCGCNTIRRKRSKSATNHRPVTSGTASKKKGNVKKMKKRQNLGLSEVLQNVLHWFEFEMATGAARYLHSPKRRLVKATKLGYGVIQRRLDELDPVQRVVKSLVKKEEKEKKISNKKLSNTEEELVGKTVLDLQSKSQSLSISILKTALKEKGIDASETTIKRTLDKLGFRFCWKDKCWEIVPSLRGVYKKRSSQQKDNANSNEEDEEEEEDEDEEDLLEFEDGNFSDMEEGASPGS